MSLYLTVPSTTPHVHTGGMAGVLESIRSGQVSLKKARVEERKPPERKRTYNVYYGSC